MRTKSAIATFVALGASTSAVSALDTVPSMRGSDTLNGITDAVITICEGNAVPPRITPAGSIVYDGTGSGNGQANIAAAAVLTVDGAGNVTEAPIQTIGPMSRTMNGSVCANMTAPFSSTGGAFDSRGEAEGLAFALDGLSIIASNVSTAAAGCSAPPGADICAPNPTGIGYTGTAGGETINDWREILRIVYAGLATGVANASRDCNSPARQAILASWNELFQADCPTCDDPATPNQVRHAFRRDEESGTTDVFLTLLNLPTVNFNAGAAGSYDRFASNSHFCNVKRTGDPYTIPVSAQPHGSPATWDNGTSGLPQGIPFLPEFQDMDPVRRPCVGAGNAGNLCTAVNPAVGCLVVGDPPLAATEQVCGPKGDLGVVLPINPPPVVATSPTPYPTKYCATGRFRFADAPRNSLGGTTGIFCPNGDLPLGTLCQHPTAADGDFACINAKNSVPGSRICNGTASAPAACTTAEGTITALTQFTGGDGRVYNLHLKTGIEGAAGAGAYQTINRPNPNNSIVLAPQRIVGAYYRIHATRSLHAPFDAGCQQVDATRQLGCLTTKSHCSLSFAGREGVTTQPGAAGMRLDQIPSEVQCVQNLVTGAGNVYPLSRKLYVNSARGFENLNYFGFTAAPTTIPTLEAAPDNEQQLLGCFANIAPATVSAFGFIEVPGGPFCEDFNEMALCNTGVLNVNACADNAGVIPNNAAFCGDGIVQAPAENCDDANAVNTGDACPNDCTIP